MNWKILWIKYCVEYVKVVKWFGFLKFVDKSEKNKSINYADDVTRPLGRRGCWRGAVRGNLGAFFHRFFLLYRKILRVLGPFLLLVSVCPSVCPWGPKTSPVFDFYFFCWGMPGDPPHGRQASVSARARLRKQASPCAVCCGIPGYGYRLNIVPVHGYTPKAGEGGTEFLFETHSI